jgi:predicted amidohydrolase
LARQGADFLVHLDIDRGVHDHFYEVLSPKVRAMDCHRPFLIARTSSQTLCLVHNEEMEIAGTPMAPSVIIDQNGTVLASTGFSQGVATATLRTRQYCRSIESEANLPLSRGLEAWKLYFNDSRSKYFAPLRRKFATPRKSAYKKRKIRIAVVTHRFAHQIGKKDAPFLQLVREACRHRPDIVVCTEMETECKPEQPRIKTHIQKLVAACAKTDSHLLIGGIRVSKPSSPQDRSSHAWLWDRRGKQIFESAIMLYGRGCGQGICDTDFGRIGVRLCGDVYAPELDRLFAAKGADIVFNPSMSWGPSGQINAELGQVRAMDNGHYIVNAHLAFSDPGQRSQIIDPMGGIVAASAYGEDSILVSEIDLDSPRGIFIPSGCREIDPQSYLAAYRSRTTFALFSQRKLLKLRRPELYEGIDQDRPDDHYVTRDRGDGCLLPIPQ